MEYIYEADLIRYAWFDPWTADARRCAIALIGLNNYRHARRIGQIVTLQNKEDAKCMK